MLLDIKPGGILQHKETNLLYLVVSTGVDIDGFKPMLIHKESYFRRSLDPNNYSDDEFTKVPLRSIKSWNEVNPGDRVVCVDPIEGGCVNQVMEYSQNKYLASYEYLWRIEQFYTQDYRLLPPNFDVPLEGEVKLYGTV